MRTPLPLGTLLFVALGAAGVIHAQNHQSDSGSDRETRAECRDQGRRAPARDARAAPRRSGRGAGRLGARQLRPRSAGRPPLRQRLARLPLPARSQQSALGVYERRYGLPAGRLQPPGERVHRLRLSSRLRTERVVLHRARRARDGESGHAQLHSAGVHGSRRELPQHLYRVARHQSRGEQLRRHQARTAPRRADRHHADASVRQCRVQPGGEAGFS